MALFGSRAGCVVLCCAVMRCAIHMMCCALLCCAVLCRAVPCWKPFWPPYPHFRPTLHLDEPAQSTYPTSKVDPYLVHTPCIMFANVPNYYDPWAHCSSDKGVACTQHIQLLAHMCARAWYECTLTTFPCACKHKRTLMFSLKTILAIIHHAEQLHMLTT